MGIKKTVSVLGLGRMGTALASALVGQGYEVTTWNRSERPTPAKSVATPEEAFEADIVVTCLSTYDVQQPLLSNKIKTLVNLTSGTPEQARATAQWAKVNGVEYVDGVIMAVPQQIGTEQARILYSGQREHHVLDVFGEPVHLGEDPGLAALYDLALLGIMWSAFGGFLQAQALVQTAGVTPEQFTPLATDWLATVNTFLPGMGERTRSKNYETDVSALDINVEGLRLLTAASREQGLDTTVPQALHDLFERAQRNGHGAHSIASVIEEIRK